jgi:phosphoglycolate phosphatase-like HAD superfamily hydrolase
VSRTGGSPGPAPRRPGPAPDGLLDGIDLVIFDKDGTLIDFDAMWSPWIVELTRRLGSLTGMVLTARLYAELGFDPVTGRTIAGAPLAVLPMADLRRATTDALVRAGVPEGTAANAVDQAWFVPDPVASALPITHLPSLFGELRRRGLRVAVATSDDRRPTELTMAGLGVEALIDAYVCADDGLPVKPAPDMVVDVCRRLGVEPGRTAVVGDSRADLAMGRAAGAGRVVGVLSGVSARADLEPLADVILATVADLVTAEGG